ncbi:MAG: Lrp/AsnC family transcriptional regulator [Deltaproteobacteria bacterium]|nr:Lrp/AsnC family transcriptional regulator [Deltaproteobacteria bacterium]
MKLSEKEGAILAAAELRAEAPISLLRKESGYREHTIRYALKRLADRRVIVPIPFVNLHVLGYTIFNLFFSIGSQKQATKNALMKAFQSSGEVLWIGEFGGEFQYGIAICGKRIGEVLELVESLSRKFQDVFFEKAVSCQFSARIYHRKYLAARKYSVQPLVCRFTKEIVEIDELDDRILRAMATFGDLSHRQLALKVQIPLSTLDLRLRKLSERGVIAGHIFAVDPSKFGVQAFKLLIYGKGISGELSTGLARYAEAHPHVTYLIECLGTWDYEIGVEVQRAEDVTAIIQDLYEQFGANINTIKLLSKFRDVKFRWYPG